MRSQSELLKNKFEHLNSKKIHLKDKLWKCRMSRYEWLVSERLGITEDVYDIVMEKLGRGEDIG